MNIEERDLHVLQPSVKKKICRDLKEKFAVIHNSKRSVGFVDSLKGPLGTFVVERPKSKSRLGTNRNRLRATLDNGLLAFH